MLFAHQHKLHAPGSQTTLGQGCLRGDTQTLMIDLSPSIGRLTASSTDTSGKRIAPCIMPHQLLWLQITQPRIMLGREALLFQGYPISRVAEHADRQSESCLQDLAGNAMSLPVLLAVVMSACQAMVFRGNDELAAAASGSNEADVEHELSLLHVLAPRS